MHLLHRQEHSDKCDERRCASNCGFTRFHEWLDAPLMPWHVRQVEREQARLAALLRGEVPV